MAPTYDRAMPKIFDVRRHAKRAEHDDEDSGLSSDGRAMALALAATAPAYALVAASPIRRARETAELIGGRVDETVPGLAPDLGPLLSYGAYLMLSELSGWIGFVQGDPAALRMADEQLGVWAGLAARVRDGESALAVSHGGVIEIPAAALALRLGANLGGPAFGYCEGVRVAYEGSEPVAIEVLRV